MAISYISRSHCMSQWRTKRKVCKMNLLLNEAEAANQLGLSLRSLQSRRKHGEGPEYIKSGRSYFYRVDQIQEWLNSRSVKGTKSRFLTQKILISDFFGLDISENSHGNFEFTVDGSLDFEVQEDGQVWTAFLSRDGKTALTFECIGFRVDGSALWSTGDVTISRIGGNDVDAQ